MTTDSGKKPPREFWLKRDSDETLGMYFSGHLTERDAYDTKRSFEEVIHVREVTPCTNCERLEGQLLKTEESSANQYQKVQRLQAQLAMCKEALDEIKLKSGMCVFGTSEMAELPIEAFRQGSHIAFNECAHIATQALAKLEGEK